MKGVQGRKSKELKKTRSEVFSPILLDREEIERGA